MVGCEYHVSRFCGSALDRPRGTTCAIHVIGPGVSTSDDTACWALGDPQLLVENAVRWPLRVRRFRWSRDSAHTVCGRNRNLLAEFGIDQLRNVAQDREHQLASAGV